MSQERVAFIGREDEIRQIDQLITDWDKRRVLSVQGDGGVGKSRMLQEIRDRCLERQDAERLAVTEVLTFDDRALHLPENLRYRLAQTLGEENFGPYCRQLLDFRKVTSADYSMEQLEQKQQRLLKAFHECLSATLRERRGVILLDTTDAIEEGSSIWEYITSDLVLPSYNALFIIAGRNAGKIHERLYQQIDEHARSLELSPLTPKDSMKYLLARQAQLHCVIDPGIAEKIVFLAQGLPILIDLAVVWLAHEVPLPWLEEESLEDIKALSPELMISRKREFTHNLVGRVFELRTSIDRLFLALAHVYPVNTSLVAVLLGLSEEEAAALLEEARSYIAVKELPGGWFTLHDEVRRLLQEVEAERDPERRRRQADNQRAAAYFEAKVNTLREERQALEERGQESSARYVEVDREYWIAAGQWLHHKVRVSQSEGMAIFTRVFDEATEAYRFAVRKSFIRQVDRVYRDLTSSQKYDVDIRRVKAMLDAGRYQHGKNLLLNMLELPDLQPAQQIDMHIQLGNLDIRLGDFKAGLDSFEEAVRLSRENSLTRELMLALNALGWGNRLIGNFKLAIKHYREALELSITLGDRKREAWILNNTAFAYAHLGRHKAALSLCNQALEVWHEVDFDRGLGAVHEVFGEVYVLSSRFAQALEHYAAALEIFEPSNDREWLSRVYVGCGLAYRLSGDLERAKEFLDRAIDMRVERDRTLILHRLAHIYLEKHDIDKAEDYFIQSYDLAMRVSDADLELNNLSDLAEIALHKGQYDRLEEFKDKFDRYKEKWPDVNFYRAEGTLLKTLGDMALCRAPEDLDAAWMHYKQAFPLLAEYGELQPYSVEAQIQNLDTLLKDQQTPAHVVRELGLRLRELWQEQNLDDDHPEVLPVFLRWGARGEERYA